MFRIRLQKKFLRAKSVAKITKSSHMNYYFIENLIFQFREIALIADINREWTIEARKIYTSENATNAALRLNRFMQIAGRKRFIARGAI